MDEPAPQRRVLVVEDEDNIATALEYLLTRQGFLHHRLNSGAGALVATQALLPDLVLLDVMLPEVSGFDICAQIRRDGRLNRCKILMMTARGSAQERLKALAAGADGFIAKPFELKELRAEIERLLPAAA